MKIAENSTRVGSISKWFTLFAKEEQIHQSDLNRYLQVINLSNLIKYFELDNKHLSLSFRITENGVNKVVAMDIVPTNSYSEESQTVFFVCQIQ